MSPKVFISHASEDKDRFVTEFAKKLRENGVDVWLDKWEMLPGDSLVDKIFEEGLKEAQAVIIVLSKYSIEKPWVREELNASVVNKIDKGTRLIPVVLDNCAVPESLKGTLWESIKNLNSYQENFDRILASIFGYRDKPPLGEPPAYVRESVVEIPKLTKTDNFVLKKSCEIAIEKAETLLNPIKIFFEGDESLLPEGELKESLDMLEHYGLIKLHRTLQGWGSYNITFLGMNTFLQTYVPDYEQIIEDITIAIVNKRLDDNFSLQQDVNRPIVVINHVLDLLEKNGHIKQVKMLDGRSKIYYIAPTLKRKLK